MTFMFRFHLPLGRLGRSLTNIALNVLFESFTGFAGADDREGDTLEPAELFKCFRFSRDVALSGAPRPPEFRVRLRACRAVAVEDLVDDELEAELEPESESELPEPSPPELESVSEPSEDLGDVPRRLGCCWCEVLPLPLSPLLLLLEWEEIIVFFPKPPGTPAALFCPLWCSP